MTEASEVTILGAGIVGICSALSLLERGITVRLIDRAGPPRVLATAMPASSRLGPPSPSPCQGRGERCRGFCSKLMVPFRSAGAICRGFSMGDALFASRTPWPSRENR